MRGPVSLSTRNAQGASMEPSHPRSDSATTHVVAAPQARPPRRPPRAAPTTLTPLGGRQRAEGVFEALLLRAIRRPVAAAKRFLGSRERFEGALDRGAVA